MYKVVNYYLPKRICILLLMDVVLKTYGIKIVNGYSYYVYQILKYKFIKIKLYSRSTSKTLFFIDEHKLIQRKFVSRYLNEDFLICF